MAMNPGNLNGMDMRRRTSQENLIARYRSFSILSFTAAALAVTGLITIKEYLWPVFPSALIICFDIYFLTAGFMDLWLYQKVKSIDFNTMSVENVLRLTMLYRKRHLQFMAVLIPMALALITWMAICAKAEPMMVYSMITGFIIGLGFGINAFLNFMRDYKNIMK